MKTIAALLLLIACSQAFDLSKLKPMRKYSPVLNPKYTGFEWDRIKRNQDIAPIVYPGYKPGTKPQPASAGLALPHQSRIVGGSVASHGQFPWQAFISMDNSYVCGGSLISQEWILSAGHCAADYTNFIVVLGAQNIQQQEPGVIVQQTTNKIVHEGYDPYQISNDLSLLRLPSTVPITNYINVVQLPPYSLGDLVGQMVTISGWGKYSDDIDNISPDLRYVSMPVMQNSVCANYFGNVITGSQICTDTNGGHSPCNGDSGGPLIIQGSTGRYMEVGIVSFGSTAGCEKGYPAVFTRVTSFLQWIETNTRIQIDL